MADQCFIRILVTYQTHVYTFGSLPTINKWKGDWCFKKKCQLFLVTWIKEAFTINIWVIYIVFTASFETLYTIYFGLAYRVIKFKRTSNLEQRLLISFLRVCNLKTCTEIEKRHWHDVWKRCMLLICSQRLRIFSWSELTSLVDYNWIITCSFFFQMTVGELSKYNDIRISYLVRYLT